MADKSNILASLMATNTTTTSNKQQANIYSHDDTINKENFKDDNKFVNNNQMNNRPISCATTNTNTNSTPTGRGSSWLSQTTSGGSNQHKLKQRFNVIKKLGKGTYGKVQLAINKETRQEVAIKTIKKTKIENEQDLQRVRREIQIMSSIEHPHIIHIYEVFENKDKIVLVMQYAPGGELYEYVSELKVLNDQEARRIFRQIATAIFYCHQNKICHRDLKLENILLDEKNNAKLADFGLSNVFDKQRRLKTFCGSPLYASPEIVQGSPYEGPEVDCWSLGVLLYTLVYGAMPFDGSNFKRLVKQISEACYFEPKQKSQASPLIKSLLCADPLQRATILDICSDPWVNGISPLGDQLLASSSSPSYPQTGQLHPPNSPTQTNQKHHTNLLKVAQDMANLTPVRLDILHSLLPLAPIAVRGDQQDLVLGDHHKPTNAELPPPSNKRPAKGNSKVSTENPKPITIMELDEAQDKTPTDNYAVSDLKINTGNVLDELEVPSCEKKIDPSEIKFGESAQKGEEEVEGLAQMEVEQQVLVEEKLVQSKEAIRSMQIDVQEHSEIQEVKVEEEAEPIWVEEDVREPEVVSEPMEIEQESVSDLALIEKEEDKMKQEEAFAQEKPDSTLAEEIKENVEEKLPEKEQNELNNLKEPLSSTTTPAEETFDESKQKKVKKKVIVVKKKRKVPKKDTEQATISSQQEVSDKQATETSNQENKSVEKAGETIETKPKIKRVIKTKTPGKVKIPNTFQTTDDEASSEQTTLVAAARRQSALIADVSQKLLQQLQANVADSASKPAEQHELIGVRVSDKKDEFERRASLMSPDITTTTNNKTTLDKKGPWATTNQDQELVESLRELITVMVPETDSSHAIIEPVDKRDAQETNELQKTGSCSTGEGPAPSSEQSSPDTKAEVERRFSECMRDFEMALGEPTTIDNHLAANVRDDRSDSVETIKAETLLATPSVSPQEPQNNSQSFNSTFSINLKQPEVVQRSQGGGLATTGSGTSSLSSSGSRSQGGGPVVPRGPAPITRSYKKVTFTKDGACITETGKIYSTRADDGTIRRIERKSKITHYQPTGSGSSLGQFKQANSSSKFIEKQEEEEEEEEIVYEEPSWLNRRQQQQDQDILSVGGGKHRFEKLIMPSSDFMSSNSTGCDTIDQDQFNQSQLSRRSAFVRERADSASSCSSNSTDVFDDIFDQWTGAMNMFEQHDSSIFNRSNFQQQFKNPFKRIGRMTSSLAGSPRCGSAEPKMAPNSSHRPRYSPGAGKELATSGGSMKGGSGYESDTNSSLDQHSLPRRPASGLAKARANFGSTNFFESPFKNDPFFMDSDDPIVQFHSDAMRRHEKALMKQRMKLQGQLWKGSTPSLFEPDGGLSGTRDPRDLLESTTRHQQAPLPRDESFGSGSRHSSRSAQQQQQQRFLGSPSTSGQLAQSRSGEPAISRKTTVATFTLSGSPSQLPPRVHSSNSRTSMMREEACDRSKAGQHKVARFIEIKRTSSSSTNPVDSVKTTLSNEKVLEAKQQVKTTSLAGSQLVSTTQSESTSNILTNRLSPSASELIREISVSSMERQRQEAAEQFNQSKRQENDTRVNNWLQNSISDNLSGSSSGFKSSASDATTNYSPAKDSSVTNIKSTSFSAHQLPPSAAGSRRTVTSSVVLELSGAPASGKVINLPSLNTNVERDQTMDSIVINDNDDNNSQLSRATSCSSKRSASNKAAAGATSSFSQTSTIQRRQEVIEENPVGERLREENARSQRVVVSSSSTTTSSFTTRLGNTTAPIQLTGNSSPSNSAKLDWVVSSGDPEALLAGPFEQMSLSSAGADIVDASSSLLEQLRSRGYRSMINQRMVTSSSGSKMSSGSTTGSVLEQQQSAFFAASSSSTGSPGATTSTIILDTSTQHSAGSSSQTPTIEHKLVKLTEEKSSSFAEEKKKLDILESQALDQTNPNLIEEEPGISTQDPRTSCGPDYLEADIEPIANGIDKDNSERINVVGVDEEEDEDIREAKANIKNHLDRIKETELFLKSMQKEEEKLEKQRQQLFLFNNLMLSTKLNGLCQRDMKLTSGSIDYDGASSSIKSGALSAPVSSNNPLSSLYNSVLNTSNTLQSQKQISATTTDIGGPSAALSFEPTYTLMNGTSNQYSSYSALSRDPIEPLVWNSTTNYLSSGSTNIDEMFHSNRKARSRSQLRDSEYQPSMGVSDISDYRSVQRRPLSGCFSKSSYLLDNQQVSPPFKGRRSLSQIRYPPSGAFYGNRNAPSSTMMSEYRSAYGSGNSCSGGGSTLSNSTKYQNLNGDLDSPICFTSKLETMLPSSKSQNNPPDNASDDDDGMSAYRASTYVPKVIPQGMPERISRRTYISPWKSKIGEQSKPVSNELDDSAREVRTRRVSMENASTSRSFARDQSPTPMSIADRRSSVSGAIEARASVTNENSRLSELETRIQENKKRREELLAASTSPKPVRKRIPSRGFDELEDQITSKDSRLDIDETNSSKTTYQSNSLATGTTTKLVSRPSRLESMEARIKRKSYCIRPGDYSPERSFGGKNSNQSLEKWRQNSIKTQQQQYNQATSSSSGQANPDSPRNSISGKLTFNKCLDDDQTQT